MRMKIQKKKTCIITGSRAEWGQFYPLAKSIKINRGFLTLQILATGAHLSRNFGLTYREIERDGFNINSKVRTLFGGDTEESIAKSVSLGITGLAKALKMLKPNVVFLLGDRFETFAAAMACYLLKIPIAHIAGGEVTEGSLDDGIRHAITKLSYLHFVSTDTYRRRIIQMGESPKRIFSVGALALDNIRNTKLLDKESLEKRIGFKLGKNNIMVTFNPSTSESRSSQEGHVKNLLKALKGIPDSKIIFTKPNPDMYSHTISRIIEKYVKKNKKQSIFIMSMGKLLYLSALGFMDIVAGNSSSGLVEVPAFGIPTVNIGNRQKGRIRAASVIDSAADIKSIKSAFKKALSRNFKDSCKKIANPYGDGKTAQRIVNIVRKTNFASMEKSFFDLNINFSKCI